MVRLTFIAPDGQRISVEAREGDTAMRAAVRADVPGILGECGGCATCLTCHCYVDPAHFDALPPPGDHERQMLELVLGAQPASRLACQIVLSAACEGMELHVPEEQG